MQTRLGNNLKSQQGITGIETAKAPAAPAEAKDAKMDLSSDSLSSLFAQDEEEEYPLAGLMQSLPDISAGELLDDIKEIKNIMQ
ncbi:MAG: hypothetical protein WC370_05160 [Dehalococcoidales bacterium]